MYSNAGLEFSTLTFILAGGSGKRLFPLTSGKAKPLVSFGGVFRIIDFTLSNCANSGLERAYLLTQYKSDSVLKYIQASSWTTDFVCLPSGSSSVYHGTADAIYKNMDLLRHEKADYVLVLAADHIYKMDYRRLLQFHASHGGDATIAAVQVPQKLAKQFGILDADEHGQVLGFEEKPEHRGTRSRDSSMVLASMGIYVFNTATLRKALLRDAGDFNGSHEFGKDVLPSLVRADRVFAYNFASNNNQLGTYWRDVGTIDTYYRTHMELLLVNSTFDPYADARWPVYAGGKNPSFRSADMDSSWVVDSIVSPDSEIAGASIQQSIISPSVFVAPTAHVQGSVLMQGARVGRDARIQHAIIGEGVVVPDGERIGCDLVEDRRRFHVSPNGVVAVHISDSTRTGAISQTVHTPILNA